MVFTNVTKAPSIGRLVNISVTFPLVLNGVPS
jgi:hypothetical protein